MVAAPSPLQQLTDAVHAAETFRLEMGLELPGGVILTADAGGIRNKGRWRQSLTLGETNGDDTSWKPCVFPTSVGDVFRKVASMYPNAVLRHDSVTVSIHKGATTGAKLRPIAIQAWHEVIGLPIPSLDELAKATKAAKAAKQAENGETVDLLKTGQAGVKAFNRRSLDDRQKTDLRKADLSGCDLSGIEFVRGMKLNEIRLTGARLTKADLFGCVCGDVNFAQADLTGAKAGASTFSRANFAGANLTDADLDFSDLRGADFTGAILTRCGFNKAKFDEHTRWPKGFKPPAGLVWKGEGADPRLAPTRREKARPKPTDFAGFLDRLKTAADPSKLDKAMSMLKADRFRLFAKVEADQLVGVVKSQSDPTLVYSCRLSDAGKFACCTQNLNVCGGLRGSPCKHLLVLIVGLAQAGELDPATAHDWIQASRGQKPELDKDAMTETLLSYKGAEAGEIDWRPTETIPEDFYAM